jgi:two-component system NarL family sensor kinase
MTTTVIGAAPSSEGAAPAAVFHAAPTVRSRVAAALALLATADAVLWAVLAAANHRTLSRLVEEHEVLGALVGVSLAVVGAIVLRQRPGHVLGWLFVAEGQLQTVSVMLSEYVLHHPSAGAAWIGNYLWLPGMALAAGLFTPLFPDGRPVRAMRPVAWVALTAIAAASVAFLFVANATTPPPFPARLTIAAVLVAVACGVAGAIGLLIRMARSRGPERRRIGWFFTAFSIIVIAQLLPVDPLVPTLASAMMPLALGVAMTRHRLFDGDRLLNRTLVYAILTVAVAGVFGLTVGVASNSLGGDGTGAVVAAVVISLGLAPARTAAQNVVDRFLYGARRDPYRALSDLSRHLTAIVAPEEVLPRLAELIAGVLRLPYVTITLDGEAVPAAEYGESSGATARLPLVHVGETVGTLRIGLPGTQRFLDPGDERLLQDVAHQTAAAVAGVRLTYQLRRSRDALAVSREEERHRIRRDLHDGLGPTLAGVALGLGAAKRAVAAGSPETAELLGHLETEVRESLDDVKRLVTDLRPTTLEQLGLTEALRQYAETVTRRSQGALKVTVDTGALPPLPVDVEIAAYRIVLEAVTNTTRHAGASRCAIDVATDGPNLRLSVLDDGVGLAATPQRPGIGLRSMAERATELGGSCTVAAVAVGGTLVSAVLPLDWDQ